MNENNNKSTRNEESQSSSSDATCGKKRERGSDTNNNGSASKEKLSATSLPVLINGHFGSPVYKVSPTCSPPNKKSIPMQQLVEVNDAAVNMTLAHEIALNKGFMIPDEEKTKSSESEKELTEQEKLYVRVQDAMRKAFWDSLKKDLESEPPSYDHAFVLLEEIKRILLSLLPHDRTTSLHKRIEESLDMDLLQQQAGHSALDIASLSQFLIDTLAAMCAPVRDDEVKALRNINDPVEIFRGIFKMLAVMKRDVANLLISAARPHIQQQHVEYERTKFQEILSKLPNGLTNTTSWLRQVYHDLKNEETVANLESKAAGSKTNPTTITPMQILKFAYLKFLEWDYESFAKTFPETAVTDVQRFQQLQQDYQQTVLIATVLLTAMTALSTQLLSHQPYIDSVKKHLAILTSKKSAKDMPDLCENLAEQIWLDTCEYVPSCGAQLQHLMEPSYKAILLERISSLRDVTTSQVHVVLAKRAKDYLMCVADTLDRSNALTPTLPPVPPALQIVKTEIASVALSYAKLCRLNKTIYGPFFAPLLKSILGLPSSGGSEQEQAVSDNTASSSQSAELTTGKEEI